MTTSELTGWADQVRAAGSFAELCRTALEAARTLAEADGATFVLRDGAYCFYVDEDAISPLWKGQRFPIENCISGWSMLNGVPAEVPDTEVDDRIPIEAYRPTFIRSLAMAPMGSVAPRGAIGVYWSELGRRLAPEALDSLLALAVEVGERVEALGLAAAPWAPNFAIGTA